MYAGGIMCQKIPHWSNQRGGTFSVTLMRCPCALKVLPCYLCLRSSSGWMHHFLSFVTFKTSGLCVAVCEGDTSEMNLVEKLIWCQLALEAQNEPLGINLSERRLWKVQKEKYLVNHSCFWGSCPSGPVSITRCSAGVLQPKYMHKVNASGKSRTGNTIINMFFTFVSTVCKHDLYIVKLLCNNARFWKTYLVRSKTAGELVLT